MLLPLLFYCLPLSLAYQRGEYRIGGLFHDRTQEAAFQVITDELNTNPNSSFDLVADTFGVSYSDTFVARLGACRLLENGVIGIFGPSSQHSSPYIQAICDHKEIPHLETHWDDKIERNKCVVNLHPHPGVIARFLVQLVQRFGWERMVVLFEDDDSLLRTAPLLDLNIYHGVNIILRQLELDESQSYRGVLNAIKSSEETNLLLDCSVETLGKVLKQAQQVGLMTDRYRYIVTSLDVGVLDLTDFQYSGVNLTGIWLFDPSHPKATKYEDAMLDALGLPAESLWKMKLSTALLLDGVRLFYETIGEFGDTQSELLSTQSLSCDGTKYWRFGYTIVNTIKAKKFQGITGQIQFDNEGFRRNFVLEVVELTPAGLSVVGQWNSSVGELKVDRSRVRVHQEPAIANPFNRTFTVITTLTAPYAMLKETTAQLTGNDRFEGFCVDVIQELSAMLGFNYTFIIQADGANGDLNRITYEWNGMIREIIDGNADLAIADLTITSERENAVDFTMPFMNLGISVLYRKPEPVPPSLFMFTSPFSTSVWVMLGVAYLLVSFAIFIMGRLSPSEWTNPFPCVEEPEYLINQFSIRNSLWFTIGALMQQGSELAPIVLGIVFLCFLVGCDVVGGQRHFMGSAICYLVTKLIQKSATSTLVIQTRKGRSGGKLLEWVAAFLSQRSFRVRIGYTFSLPQNVPSGVPQGSVLEPVLFLVYLLSSIDSRRDLNAISKWCSTWL
ncbi:glutamate receptor ionotropic, kainate 2-like isoform X4 [Cylas formicarius]|uniref:glutamate receptor ionotropic, kainate 2-like isoform X4 n=1 Tax=Cylas formicarius TaxID=197179 RepID=UPI002958457D|nr:glutamate receptor ionotropic, kainate 2-like isoform X4 [Cylas formicarius]